MNSNYNNHNNNNNDDNNINNSRNLNSMEMEEKLPEQILDGILLEGLNSSELLQNVDIHHMANILATLRYDLSTLLNEEIDEFQFQFSQ